MLISITSFAFHVLCDSQFSMYFTHILSFIPTKFPFPKSNHILVVKALEISQSKNRQGSE